MNLQVGNTQTWMKMRGSETTGRPNVHEDLDEIRGNELTCRPSVHADLDEIRGHADLDEYN